MCVAVPLKVRSLSGNCAVLESSGVIAEADISLVENVRPGDYLLIHAGFAIARLSPEEAEETLAIFQEMAGGIRS